MFHVMLLIPVPGNQPGCTFPPGHGAAAAAGLGAVQECVQGAACGRLRVSQSWHPKQGTDRWSVWMGHVSLGAVSDSALLWLWRHITPPMFLHWVHAVPPTQNREEAGRICFLFVSQQRGYCALFPGCNEAGGDGKSLPVPPSLSFQAL